MNTVAIRVGRLLEARALCFKSAAEVEAIVKTMVGELARLPSTTQIVAVADWRYCLLLSSEVAQHALAAMMRNNQRVLRAGVLASQDSATATLQFSRLVRESGHPSRRLFFDEDELTRWLGEVLTDAEKLRLTEFLHEPVSRQAKP